MRNSEYSKKNNAARAEIYTGTSTAPQIETEGRPERKRQLSRARRLTAAARERRLVARLKVYKALAMAAAVAFVLVLIIAVLGGSVESNELTRDIRNLENQLSELTVQNDSKEYDIISSVDINTVIKVATEELGMVRGSADMIIGYDADGGEYIMQVAELPGR